MVDVGCAEKQKNYTEFIDTRKMLETALLLFDKSLVIRWVMINVDVCLIDFVAVLAIVVAGYDEVKQQALRDQAFRIKPLPDDFDDDSFQIGLLRLAILKPDFYLWVVHKEFGELPLDELKVFAKPLLKLQGENMAINRTVLKDCLDRQRKAL